jgi:hypothetical protein
MSIAKELYTHKTSWVRWVKWVKFLCFPATRNYPLPLDSVVWYRVYSLVKEEQRWVSFRLDKWHAEPGLA